MCSAKRLHKDSQVSGSGRSDGSEPETTEDDAMTSQPKRQPPPQVDIVKPTYQPSKAELEEDVRVNATFEEAVSALTRPVQVNYIPRPRKR